PASPLCRLRRFVLAVPVQDGGGDPFFRGKGCHRFFFLAFPVRPGALAAGRRELRALAQDTQRATPLLRADGPAAIARYRRTFRGDWCVAMFGRGGICFDSPTPAAACDPILTRTVVQPDGDVLLIVERTIWSDSDVALLAEHRGQVAAWIARVNTDAQA